MPRPHNPKTSAERAAKAAAINTRRAVILALLDDGAERLAQQIAAERPEAAPSRASLAADLTALNRAGRIEVVRDTHAGALWRRCDRHAGADPRLARKTALENARVVETLTERGTRRIEFGDLAPHNHAINPTRHTPAVAASMGWAK